MTSGAGMVAGGDEAVMGRRSLVRGRDPFGFALSKIPTSRAKNAREMGHPRFSFRLAGGRDNLERVGKGRDPSTAVGLCALRKDQSSLRMTGWTSCHAGTILADQ